MSKQRQWWILLVCGLAVILLAYQHQHGDPAPSFTACLDDISNANANRGKAQDAIRHIGTNALPLLLQQLRYEPSTNNFKHRLSALLDKLPRALLLERLIYWAHSDREEARAWSAVRIYHSLGEQARPAIPELTQLLNDPEFPSGSRRAFSALAFIGKESIPALAAYLADTNKPPHRQYLTQWLYSEWIYQSTYQWSDNGRARNALTVPLLLSCLASPNPREASGAAFILGVFVSTYPTYAGVVVEALSNSPPTMRLTAARVLGQPTRADHRFVPLLLPLAEDPDESVRSAAIAALHDIDLEAIADVPVK